MPDLPFVSVIIPVFNDPFRLAVCLEALGREIYPKNRFEVLAVDNASTENIKGVTDKFGYVKYLFEPASGPAAARNTGIRASKGEILAFTDSDCVPSAFWLENGVLALSEAKGAAFAAGKIEMFYKVPNCPGVVELYDTISYFDQKRYVEKYKFGATANLFVFKSVMDKIGYFDNTFFKTASGEDAEWGERAFKAGYRGIYAENAKVTHAAVRSFSELRKKTERVARGNSILNKIKSENSFSHSAKNMLESISFHYRQIWRAKTVKGLRLKAAVSLIGIVMILVKIRLKWFHDKSAIPEKNLVGHGNAPKN